MRIWNQRGEDTALINPFQDAVSFAVGVMISTDLVSMPEARYQVDFQIIDSATGGVVKNLTHTYQLPEPWPSWWLTVGNNWSPPYTTLESLGLSWIGSPAGIFGFRGILTAWLYREPVGQITIDAFDVSAVRWFHILPIATL
jgi:hypothetical protein